jgi:hypothetical protein
MPAFGVVVGTHAARPARCARRNVDDASPLARPHAGHDGLCAEKYRFQIHRDGAVEILLSEIVEAANQTDAGVVDQDVDGAQLSLDRGDHLLHRSALRHIARDGDGLAARFGDCIDRAARLRRLFEIIHGDGGARLGQRNRDGAPDAARPARHKCNSAFKYCHSAPCISTPPPRHVTRLLSS